MCSERFSEFLTNYQLSEQAIEDQIFTMLLEDKGIMRYPSESPASHARRVDKRMIEELKSFALLPKQDKNIKRSLHRRLALQGIFDV